MSYFAGHYTMNRAMTHLVIEGDERISGHLDLEDAHRDISDGRVRYRCGRSLEFITVDDIHEVKERWSLMFSTKRMSLVGTCEQTFKNGKTNTRTVLFKRDEPTAKAC